MNRSDKESGEDAGNKTALYTWAMNYAIDMGSMLQIEETAEKAVEGIASFCDEISGTVLYVLDHTTGLLYPQAHRGLGPEYTGGPVRIGEGRAGKIAGDRNPVYMPLLPEESESKGGLLLSPEFSSYTGLPLTSGNKITGVIELFCRTPRAFSSDEKEILEYAACVAGNALNNALQYDNAADRAKRLIGVSRAITVTRQLGTLKKVLLDIARVLVHTLGFDKSWIGIVNEAGDLVGMAGSGNEMQKQNCFFAPVDAGSANPAIQAVLTEKPVIYQFVDDVEDVSCRKWLKKNDIEALAFVPVVNEDEPVGVIGVFTTGGSMLTDEDIKTIVSVSEQTAIAVENSHLYERVKQSEEDYKTLFQASGSGLAIIDKEQRFTLVNNAFEIMCGYSQKDLISGFTLTSFLSGKDLTRKEITTLLVSPPRDFEAELTDKTGRVKQVHVTNTQLPNNSTILVSVVNVTKQRELEKKLFKSEELAAIGELSAGIAHEIRNPLIALKTSVKLLRDEPHLSDEGNQLLDVLQEESDHLAAIVDDFLKFARPKKPQIEPTDLNQVIGDTVRRCRDLAKIDIEWIEEYDDALPQVPCDRHQIQQVLTNLINNGLDAMAPGASIAIRTGREKDENSNTVFVAVKDTGGGIPDDEQGKIFQPFFSTKESGTGMGLAICQRIVDAHNGEITVTSRKNKGTEFSVILPIA